MLTRSTRSYKKVRQLLLLVMWWRDYSSHRHSNLGLHRNCDNTLRKFLSTCWIRINSYLNHGLFLNYSLFRAANTKNDSPKTILKYNDDAFEYHFILLLFVFIFTYDGRVSKLIKSREKWITVNVQNTLSQRIINYYIARIAVIENTLIYNEYLLKGT